MAATKRAYHNKLLDIGTTARSMKSLCRVNPQPQPLISTDTAAVTIPPLSLPNPDAIVPLLLSQGCPQTAAQILSNTFLRSAHQTRVKFESNYQKTCTKLAPHLMSDPVAQAVRFRSLSSLVELQYQDQISAIKGLALERFKAHQKPTVENNVAKPKPTFNQEYVPLLEKYFEYNAYPSAPDRSALARKSMMTPRQIEVWFQNHRNRSKKEGKALRRLTLDHLPLKLSLESLEKTMPFFVIPEEERKDPFVITSRQDKSNVVEEENHNPILPQIPSTFSDTAPPHAFPAPYSPTPVTERCTFAAPVWMRHSSTVHPPRAISSVDDLIADFSIKLVFSEPSSKHRRASPQPLAIPKSPWFAATHTTPPPAPHPAFVRSSFGHIQTITTPSSGLRPARSPSPAARPAMAPISNSSAPRRKVVRLSKRTPKLPSATYRGASPATSEASSSSSRSFTRSSRTSSFSSDSSFISKPSSSSSNSSTASSPLTTPVLSPTSLPENAPSPISISGVDFQNINDWFSDSPNAMSPLDALDLNYHLHSFPTISGKDIFKFDFKTPTSRPA